MSETNIYNPRPKDIILSDIICLDTEGSGLDTLTANCSVISIYNPEAKLNYALDINGYLYTKAEISTLLQRISQCKIVIAHNAKYDLGILKSNFGILLRNQWCTMLASQLLDNGYGYVIKKEDLQGTQYAIFPGRVYYTKNMIGHVPMMPGPHSLLGCLKRFLDIDLRETSDKKRLQHSFINLPRNKTITKEQLEYACSDVQYLYDLYLAELNWIKKREQDVQVKLENKLTPVLVKMEHKGSLINVDLHKSNIKKWKEQLLETERQLDIVLQTLGKTNDKFHSNIFSNKRVKEEVIQTSLFQGFEKTISNENHGNINYSSNQELTNIFKLANQPLPTDDTGKISFGEESIKFYVTNFPESTLKPFLVLLLEYKEYSKLLSTYGTNLLELLDSNNRMRTSYTQAFTDTGRLTSSAIVKDKLGLNLANLPKRPDIRKIFIPDEDYSFIDSDMTGQELFIVGGYSKEDTLLKAFKDGFDHHSYFASISYSLIFNRPIEIKNEKKNIQVDNHKYNLKTLRDVHKNAIFSKVYLGGPKRIQALLNEYLVNHVEADKRYSKCEEISNALDAAMPKMMKYLKDKVKEAQKVGYVSTTFYNRRRYFDNPDKAYGDAANFDIQATGAMAIKTALINIDKWLLSKSKELNISEDEFGWITMSIYDQNLVCLNDKYLNYATDVQDIMAKALTAFLIDLEGSSDLNIRKEWGK